MRKKVTHIKMKNRIIALGLSFMMIATSLQAFKETSKVARADGEPEFEAEALVLDGDSTLASVSSGTNNALNAKRTELTYKSMDATVGITLPVTGSPSIKLYSGTYTDGLGTSETTDDVTISYDLIYPVEWKICSETKADYLDSLDDKFDALPENITLDASHSTYWIYAKAGIPEVQVTALTNNAPEYEVPAAVKDAIKVESTTPVIDQYSLQYIVKYVDDSSTWTSVSPTSDTSDYTNSGSYYNGMRAAEVLNGTYCNPTAGTNTFYVGKIKYAVAKKATNTETVDECWDRVKDDLAWKDNVTDTVVTESGSWFVYVGYFSNNDILLNHKGSSSWCTVDKDAPTISDVGLYVHEKTDGTGTWTLVNGANGYVLDFDKNEYQYRVTISDEISGINSKKITSDAEGNVDTGRSLSTVSGDVYKYQLVASDLPTDGTALQWYVVASDNVNNVATVTAFSPTVQLPDMTMADPMVSFQYEGESTPIGSLPAYIHKPLNVKVSVTSGYKIDSIKLKKETADFLSAVQGTDAADGIFVNEYVPSTNGDVGRYKAEYTFTIPQGTPETEILKALSLEIVDTASTPQSKTKDLGETWYDSTKPVVSYTTSFDSEWHQSYNLGYEVTSGGAASDDTALSEVKVLVDPSSGTVAGSEVTNDVTVPADTLKLENQQITVPTSANIGGTKVTIKAKDLAGNELDTDNVRYVKVDGENPSIDVSAMDLGGVSFTAEGKLQGNVILDGKPVLKINAKDNLTLKTVTVAVKYPGEDSVRTYILDAAAEAVELNKNLDFVIKNPDTTGQALDGDYSVTMIATDKAGNSSPLRTVKFRLDNTNPVVSASIYDGTKGGKYPREDGTDEYYKSDVVVKLTAVDDNMDSITVLDNGNEITPTWKDGVAYATIEKEGYHTITIDAVDKSGHEAARRAVGFRIDKTAPSISLSLNGTAYVETRGRVNLMSGAEVNISVSDDNEDAEAFMYQVIRQTPDVDDFGDYVVTSGRSLSFAEEGDYTLNFITVDKAGNTSAPRSMQFRIDRTAPSLQVLGGVGGISTSDSVITLVMRETFWKDASGTATIYRKANDSTPEVLYKTIDIIPTSQETRIAEHITENGIYRVEFEAKDQIGHTTETTQSITIDRNAPVVVLTGVNNYDKTNTAVRYYLEITEDFYTTKVVRLSGTRTDSDGSKHELGFPIIDQRANPTIVDQTFSADGIYDITIDARDAAGNKYANTVHFTIDQTAPEIGDISKYDKKNFKEFVWDLDLDELVSDLTVCDVHMYLNGVEYDGESEIDDGAYTLLITAEDELGNKSEAQANFVLDTKAPVFIVDGVEEDEIKNSPYSITVSLQLEEDTLVSVQLNGEEVEIKANTAHVTVNDPGEYSLKMVAVDEAGNQAMKTYFFAYGEEKAEKSFPIIAVVGSVLGLLAVGGIFVAIKKRK